MNRSNGCGVILGLQTVLHGAYTFGTASFLEAEMNFRGWSSRGRDSCLGR